MLAHSGTGFQPVMKIVSGKSVYFHIEMGIDFLDFTFRLEKKLALRLRWEAVESFFKSRHPRDITVAEIQQAVLLEFEATLRPGVVVWSRGDMECPGCGFPLDAVPIPGFCRICGTAVRRDQFVATIVRKCLSEALDVSENKVEPGALLIKDLGMS